MESQDVALIEAKPQDVARRENGQFAPGHAGGLKKGSLNKITATIKAELAAELEATGIEGNPLVILARIARNETYEPSVRMQAADRLARYLAPQLTRVEVEAPDASFELETQKIRATLRSIVMEGRS